MERRILRSQGSSLCEKMNRDTQAFLALVRSGLWGTESRFVPYGNVDYKVVLDLAMGQSLIGLVAAGLEQVADVKVPQEWALQFVGQTLQIEQRNKAMNIFIAGLIEKLRENDIYTLLVKGQGIAQCYEKPLWRSSGDVDLFLSEDNYPKAKALLVPVASSVEEEYGREKHLGMTINGWVVELHGHLYSGLSSKVEKELDRLQEDTFYGGQVRSWLNGNTQVFLLKAGNDAFYVFTHILQHFYKGGIGLRQICDWCSLLYTYRDSIDCDLLEQRIRRAGLTTEWKALYALASKYLGMPDLDSGFMFHDSRFDKKADRIMEFVLMSGNMGLNRGSWLTEHGSWLGRQYVVRKTFSMFRRIGDLINHARIFPLDSLRFFPYMMINGVRSAMKGV